jgi:HD-like signal output (HDOD) protein
MLDALFDAIMGGPEKRAQVNKIAGTINIPSQPQVMAEINAELAKKDADFGKVSTLVSRDVGMSAKLLKVANSPLYAPKTKVESIDQALLMLGVKQFKQTIFSSALRATFAGNQQANEQFWAHSEGVGSICEALSREFCPEHSEYAYLTGLFHDCAVPVLLERGASYQQLLPRVLGRDRTVGLEEEQECEIEHGSLGLVMTRSWSVPVEVVRAIRAHHSDDFMGHDNLIVSQLHAVLVVAENYILNTNNEPDEIFAEQPNGELLEKLAIPLGRPKIDGDAIKRSLSPRLTQRLFPA